MFEVGFSEVVLLIIVGLVVIGPEKLPTAIRTIGLWVGRFKRSYRDIRADIERELGADDIRRELHNEEVLRNLQSSQQELNNITHDISSTTSSLTALKNDIKEQ